MKLPNMKSPKIVLSIISFILLVDLGTKYLAQVYLARVRSLEIIPNFFDLTYVENRGAAFGLLADLIARNRRLNEEINYRLRKMDLEKDIAKLP